MRNLMHSAIISAREVMDGVVGEIQKGARPSDDELMDRYVRLHRGNPAAMAQFTAGRVQPGQNALAEMRRYEAAMEQKLRDRGVQ
jgi:hypothetical protein